jgi:hypothetical protein
MRLNIIKKSLIFLASLAVLMTLLISPAAANTELTVGIIGSSSLNLHESTVLQYDLDVQETYPDSYRLEITLKNNNSSETGTGFEFFDYTGKVYAELDPLFQAVIKNATVSPQPDGSIKLIYGFENPNMIRVDVTVRANGSQVYPEEEVKITAELFQGFASTTPMTLVSPPEFLEVKPLSDFPGTPMTSSFRTVFISPPAFSASPTEYQVELNLTSSELYSLNVNYGGMFLQNAMITLDFSNVMIGHGGTTKSYQAWIDDGASPVKIYHGSTLLDNSNGYSFTLNPVIYRQYLVVPLKFETTDHFTSGDFIDFGSATLTGTAYVNARGPSISIGSVGSDVSFSFGSSNHTPPLHSSEIVLMAPYSNGGTIQANSEQYFNSLDSNHLLYYQDLAKIHLTSNIVGGENMTVTLDVPSGVTLTHVRMPSPTSNAAQSEYESVSIVRGSTDYELSTVYPSANHVYNITLDDLGGAYAPGEDIVFKFTNLSKIQPQPSGIYSYDQNYLITLIGTTGSAVADGTTLTFTGSIDGGPTSSPLELNVSDTYIVTSNLQYMSSFLSLTPDYANPDFSTLNPGNQFYLYSRVQGTWYPYFSAHRLDPFRSIATSAVSNPVIYFSVPYGFDFDPDQIVLTNAVGTPINLKDIAGNDLKLSSRVVTEFTGPINNLYGDGSKLVEVKFEQENPTSTTFWIQNSSWGAYHVQLPLKVALDYDGPTHVVFKNETVLLSTWDPNAVSMRTAGASGRTIQLNSIRGSETIVGKVFGSYSTLSLEKIITITDPFMASISAGVQTPGGLQYYNPGNPNSFLKLKAGSQNEKFAFSAINYLSDSFSNAKIYFLLPHGDGWVPEVNGITITNFPADGDYKIFYSVDSTIDDTFIGTAAVDSAGDIPGLTWVSFTINDPTGSFGSPTIDGSGIPWGNIRAIKYEFGSFDNGERLSTDISFNLPPLQAAGIDYDVVGHGQTLYYLDGIAPSNSEPAPAIQLVKSDEPIIKGYNTTTSTAVDVSSLPTGSNTTSAILDWYTVFVYDDFTTVPLSEVKIIFTPTNTSLSPVTHTLNTTAELGTPVSYTPPTSEGVFAQGFRYSIPNPGNYINTTTPGVYVITYTTDGDGDLNVGIAMRTLTISKDPATVSFSGGTADILYTDSVPSGGWSEHFKSSLTSKTDLGSPIADSSIVFESSTPLFDSTVPGVYNFTYSYTDIGMNRFVENVTVAVKYITPVNVDVIANGESVLGLNVLDSGNGVTFSGTPYSASFTASTTSPGSVTVAIDVSSTTIPAGINNTITNPLRTETFSLSNPPVNPIEIYLTPISIEVVPAGFVDKIISVSMMDSSNTLVPGQDKTGPFSATPVSFTLASGWFTGGSYSFYAEVEPGYTFSGDFTQSITSYVLGDSAFTVANADVSKTLNVVESPLISGKVWADTNRNSIIDAGESAVSGATVNIYNSSTDILVVSVTTDTDGAYQVYNELASSNSYYVEIQMPTGFNTVSALQNDQGIDNSFKSAVIPITAGSLHHTVNAGFYVVSGSGGTGNATVRTPGGATVVENEPEIVTTPEPEVVTTPEPEQQQPPQESGKTMSMTSLILALTAVVLGLVQVYSAAKLRSAKAENPNLVYQAIIIVAAIAAVIVFFLTNGIGGEVVLFSSDGLIIAAFVAIEIFLTAKIYLANR